MILRWPEQPFAGIGVVNVEKLNSFYASAVSGPLQGSLVESLSL